MKTNWIETYGKSEIKKFQDGGQMAAPAGPDAGAPAGPEAGAPAGGGDIESMIAEYAQTRDPQLAVAICDQIVQMMAQGGQGGAPAGPEAAPAGAPAGRNGMKFKRGPVFTK
jgi:hypothetical protein